MRATFSGPAEGWKGIWIENGTIGLEQARIEYAGKTAFSELPEPGAVILSGESPVLESFEENHFEGSHSYDLFVIGDVTGEGRFASNHMSFKNPVKVPVQFAQFWWSEAPNFDPEDVEYNIVIPSGADTKDTTDRSIGFHQGNTYLIDGTLWTDSLIFIEGGAWNNIKQHMTPFYEATLADIPLGRMGKAEEVAAQVALLASPRGGFTTGTNVVIDGGLTKRIQF